MGDAASYLRDTLREREAELTRTIQLVADLTAKLAEKDTRIAWLQTREDWWRGEWDTGQREIERLEACVNGLRDEVVRLTEKDAEQIFALNAQMADLRAALTTEQQAREHEAVAADNTIERLTRELVGVKGEADQAEAAYSKVRAELAEARERADYFRASRDRNGEALDAARVQLETLRAMLERCVGDTVTLT